MSSDPDEQRVLDAAEKLTLTGSYVYDQSRGDDTPIPTCAGCGASSWGEIRHREPCAVEELIAAVRALRRPAP